MDGCVRVTAEPIISDGDRVLLVLHPTLIPDESEWPVGGFWSFGGSYPASTI
ncbi:MULTISPECIES: hypothetical protein [Nostocales]|uniref:hypothetical protein n=1 Tax=Nostocales TaxID=1161 RepID=UPI001686BFDD|nr:MULTISPECIES: hypothetical protein [Nostocales]MBD2474195.1 hypothetical protein [Anabaena sp. FACHB-83]MBD2488795.1 hypothetical protein [Aulosira sp. FACHB-615]